MVLVRMYNQTPTEDRRPCFKKPTLLTALAIFMLAGAGYTARNRMI